jgi:quinol monooxygenase YgiN
MPGVVTIDSSCFVARYPVRADKRDEFIAVLDRLWREGLDFMNAQCNFVYYGWDRTDRWFYTIESYKDETMLKGLRESEMFQTTVRTLLSLCDGNMEFQLLRGAEGSPAIFDDYLAGPSQVHPKAGDIQVLIA